MLWSCFFINLLSITCSIRVTFCHLLCPQSPSWCRQHHWLAAPAWRDCYCHPVSTLSGSYIVDDQKRPLQVNQHHQTFCFSHRYCKSTSHTHILSWTAEVRLLSPIIPFLFTDKNQLKVLGPLGVWRWRSNMTTVQKRGHQIEFCSWDSWRLTWGIHGRKMSGKVQATGLYRESCPCHPIIIPYTDFFYKNPEMLCSLTIIKIKKMLLQVNNEF